MLSYGGVAATMQLPCGVLLDGGKGRFLGGLERLQGRLACARGMILWACCILPANSAMTPARAPAEIRWISAATSGAGTRFMKPFVSSPARNPRVAGK
jgi:hypothetical protein